MDACYGEPRDPRWVQFCREVLPIAVSLGAHASASQTKELSSMPHAISIPKELAHQRFVTPYYAGLLGKV